MNKLFLIFLFSSLQLQSMELDLAEKNKTSIVPLLENNNNKRANKLKILIKQYSKAVNSQNKEQIDEILPQLAQQYVPNRWFLLEDTSSSDFEKAKTKFRIDIKNYNVSFKKKWGNRRFEQELANTIQSTNKNALDRSSIALACCWYTFLMGSFFGYYIMNCDPNNNED